MPTEYTALVEALQNTNIPFKEYGWETRPDANFGAVSLDFEAGSLNGDGGKQDRAFEGSVDVFFREPDDRAAMAATVEKSGVSPSRAPARSTMCRYFAPAASKAFAVFSGSGS